MSKPKHRRCDVCNCVTARYSHSVQQGAITFHIWIPDPKNGEVMVRNGVYVATALCKEHADK